MIIYMIGIGGNAASYLVDLALARGDHVQGSDSVESANTEMTRKKGVQTYIGHNATHITHNINEVWFSSSITDKSSGLAELERARELGIVTKTFAEAAAEFFNAARTRVAIAGTHGKSTTTAMLGWILESSGMDPTVALGAAFTPWKGNTRVGNSDIFIIEADEYAKRFLEYKPTHTIITSLESDHFDTYPTEAELVNAFRQFIDQTSEIVIGYGLEEKITTTVKATKARIVRYGLFQPLAQFDVSAEIGALAGIEGRTAFTIHPADVKVSLQIPGLHNVLNATAAFAMAIELGVDHKVAATALSLFPGVKQRFERIGEVRGVPIYNDYAHHPTEIIATLAGTRQFYPHREIILVHEPHQAGRLAHLMNDTAEALTHADQVVLLPVYQVTGREEQSDIEQATSDKLAELARKKGAKVQLVDSYEAAASRVEELLHKNAVVITMGATDVGQVGERLIQG